MKLYDNGTKLVINNIAIKDQAIYQCFLGNQAGHISASTLIKIISFAPKFLDNIQNMTVYSDTNIELPCNRVDGSPKPKITWTKFNMQKTHDENLMYSSNSEFFAPSQYEEDYFNANNQENTDLILKNVNKKNEGWYRCEASNLLGKISADFFLQIKSN